MDLITLIIVLLVVFLVIYLIRQYLPVDPQIKNIIIAVVVIILIIWLLQGIGFLPSTIHIGK